MDEPEMMDAIIADLLRVNEPLAKLDSLKPEDTLEALALLFDALSAVPDSLLQDFEAFNEAMLADHDAESLRIAKGEIAIWAGPTPLATLLDAARLLRALDGAALETSRYVESDLPGDLEARWRTQNGGHFVIPRLGPLRALDGRPFRRRALRHHRVLPCRIDKFAIRLHRSPMRLNAASAHDDGSETRRAYGAALFPNLTAQVVTTGQDEFLVDDVTGFDGAALLEAHLGAAADQGCEAIVWPELTMPEAHLALLRAILARHALDERAFDGFLVAGSWHRHVGGAMRNVSAVLDSAGEPLFEVSKWAKFKFNGLREAIVVGDEIHLLVHDDQLILVAICRDFLQETAEVAYRRLPVDIAIVPSMTATIDDVATMQGHAATAHTMGVRFGTRTLVVAQPAVAGLGGVGRVHAFAPKPLTKVDGDLVTQAWRLCPLEAC